MFRKNTSDKNLVNSVYSTMCSGLFDWPLSVTSKKILFHYEAMPTQMLNAVIILRRVSKKVEYYLDK